jgi:predicted ester cyclase
MTMSAEENKMLAHRMVDDCINKNNPDVLEEIFAEDFINHSPQFGITPDRAGFKQMITGFHQGFGDYHLAIEDLISEDDKIVLRVRNTGTHTGDLMGISPTHKILDLCSITILHIVDGKVKERWNIVNELELRHQLGLM